MRHAVLAVAATTALLIGLLAFAGFAQADDTAWKAAHDTDPHLPLTSQQLQMTAAKRAAESQSVPALPGPTPTYACGGDCGGSGGYPSSASLVANQTPQITSYYCGPAAVHEALGALGVSLSQSAAAAALHTTTSGTAWSGGGTSPSGYPVPDVMNRYQGRNYYAPQYVASATSSAISTYENDLMYDISAIRAPVVGDAWEVPGGYHLNGHPGNAQIFHWFEIRGYYSYGATTLYEDSVHGATSISWSGNVPAYSSLPSYQIVSIVSGRGYVW
jgi:Tfp pilus assembly protein PilV